jgi:D-alanyl-D-alanine carboxypeptidase
MKVILVLLLLFSSKTFAQSQCESDFSAILLDEKTNVILYEREAGKLVYPASLTKVMTLYLVFEALQKGKIRLSDKIIISEHAQEISEVNKINTLHLKEGEEITVKKAIEASAIKSMNGAAVALAEKVAGDEWNFAQKMNEKAKKLGMNHSNFRNATGLHEDGQYSTAYDLARLLVAVQKDFKQYRKYFLKKTFVYNGKRFFTHNHFLADYQGATGFKTGFTSKAGFNLMATAKRGKRSLNGVIASCDKRESRDEYAMDIFDQNFEFLRSGAGRGEVQVVLR